MTVEPYFVPGGVYLRTSSGELIGQLDKPGEPFETLDEARSKLDWLDMVVQFFQQEQHQRSLVSLSRSIPSGAGIAGQERSGTGSAEQFEV